MYYVVEIPKFNCHQYREDWIAYFDLKKKFPVYIMYYSK